MTASTLALGIDLRMASASPWCQGPAGHSSPRFALHEARARDCGRGHGSGSRWSPAAIGKGSLCNAMQWKTPRSAPVAGSGRPGRSWQAPVLDAPAVKGAQSICGLFAASADGVTPRAGAGPLDGQSGGRLGLRRGPSGAPGDACPARLRGQLDAADRSQEGDNR